MTEGRVVKNIKRRPSRKQKPVAEQPTLQVEDTHSEPVLIQPDTPPTPPSPSSLSPWEVDLYREHAPTPLQQAQELVYDAWESTGRTRIKLARKALALSRDCADAYVLLGDEAARSLEEAKTLYEQGVKAGERALGVEAFQSLVGAFWNELETRPYMRARYALADCLWSLGHSREAITHFGDMLRLNPGDNQGIRFVLARCLLEIEDDKALGELLDRYKEDRTTYWAYTRALHVYRVEASSFRAEVLLKAALCANYHVPTYLLGRKPIPSVLPTTLTLGQEDEAINYAAEFMAGWAQSGDALDWLAEHTISPHQHRGH